MSAAKEGEVDRRIEKVVIAIEGLVAPRTVKNHGDVGVACQLQELPMAVRGGRSHRLVHVPKQHVELLEETALVHQDLVIARSGDFKHGLHIAPLVDSRIPATRGKRFGRVCALVAAEVSRERNHGR
jgi:hypothetical protein